MATARLPFVFVWDKTICCSESANFSVCKDDNDPALNSRITDPLLMAQSLPLFSSSRIENNVSSTSV
jgi:hypothetical protein